MLATTMQARASHTSSPVPQQAAAGRQRLVVAAASRKQRSSAPAAAQQQQEKQQEQTPTTLPLAGAPAEPPASDFWEGENFEVVGKLGYAMIPLLAALAVGVGLFASSTYNEGATVFLDSPKSQDDTIKLVPAEQLQL